MKLRYWVTVAGLTTAAAVAPIGIVHATGGTTVNDVCAGVWNVDRTANLAYQAYMRDIGSVFPPYSSLSDRQKHRWHTVAIWTVHEACTGS